MRIRNGLLLAAVVAAFAPTHAVAANCWTAPRTWTAAVVTVPQLNVDIRDNMICNHTDVNADGTITREKRLTTNTTAVGNVGAGPTDLITYTVPAGQLSADGQVLKLHAQVGMAANSNTKTLTFQFGACTRAVFTATSVNNQQGIIDIDIIRTSATTQLMLMRYLQSNNGNTTGTGASGCNETLSGAIVAKFTGASGGSASGDVIQASLVVEHEN